jgi:hypothetical protein
VKPLSINLIPLSFEGEGDKGGEVSKYSQSYMLNFCVLSWYIPARALV